MSPSLHLPLLLHNKTRSCFVTIRRIALDTDPFRVISLFKEMQREKQNDPFDDNYFFASLIKACNKLSAIRQGKSIHCYVIRFGLDRNVNVLNSLIYFYSSSVKSTRYAGRLFDIIPERTVATVNCMISGFVRNRQFDEGLGLYNRVLGGSFDVRLRPNYVTLLILISGCVEFWRFSVGKVLHSYCSKTGLGLVNEVCNKLIDLYAKFGHMDDAGRMFDEMSERDLVSWNTMIAGYTTNQDCRKAFSLFREMRTENIGCDRVSLVSLILACANSRDLDMGKVVHGYIKVVGIEVTGPLGTALVNMYSKYGLIELSKKVFNEIADENIAVWNSMIHGYAKCGHYCDALELFNLLQSRKLKPDEVTMLGLISACRNSGKLDQGIDIHSYIESIDHLNWSIVLCNALIDMYAKCGSMSKAKTVFDKMPEKDVISWTSVIVGYAINGEAAEALVAFQKMGAEKVEPNYITFIGLLLACDHAGLVEEGRNLYDSMCKVYHIEPSIEHCGCMVDMYARAGMIEEARKFFKNMPVEPNAVIWRMLINGCRVYSSFDLGLNLVAELTQPEILLGAEDHVLSSNIFAGAGRWDDVLHARSVMVARNAPKVPGKSSISS